MHQIVTTYPDERGHLFEIFRDCDWAPKMAYTVLTRPGYGRDAEQWHYHRQKIETFVCLAGEMHLAVKSLHVIHVYHLIAGDGILVTVETGERHSAMNLSAGNGVLLVLCDQHYHPVDELREEMTNWSWAEWAKSRP